MVTNYYTLKALANAWSEDLRGCIVGDVYSQLRDELTLAFASPEQTWMLRASTHPAFPFVFRSEGYNKARRNVASLFPAAFDKTVRGVHLANRDRVLIIDLDDGSTLQMLLFGPRANVFYVDKAGVIIDAFQRKEELKGLLAPETTPAPHVDTIDIFESRWRPDRKNTVRAITSAFPFFNAELAKETALRAGNLPHKPADCSKEDLQRIFDAAVMLTSELLAPEPRIYWQKERAIQFSLVFLHQEESVREALFASVDKAVSVYIRRRLGQQSFDEVFLPMEKALRAARDGFKNRLETMLNALGEESRADKYERWAHLLMAAQLSVPSRADAVVLGDLFVENQEITIPLDPALNAVENARRYYDKARRNRQARLHAEERLELIEQQALEAEELLANLQELNTRAEVMQFGKNKAKQLARFMGHQTRKEAEIPFRKYELADGFEVWVGKNAKQNDALTFKYARKFDFWLHARGVPGSHTVLRRPDRTSIPSKQILEQAAGIAAYHSKARGSNLVPVIITESKHVRKPKGAPVGTVIVEKEKVMLVPPGLPA